MRKDKRNYKKAQALVELTILSGVIIMVMGALVSYALSYNHNQKVGMLAFKRANNLADQIQTSYINSSVTLVYDKKIASVGGLFGTPRYTPVVANAGAVRSSWLNSSIDITYTNLPGAPNYPTGDEMELPRMVYEINGKSYVLTTSGFRYLLSMDIAQARRKAWIEGWNGQGLGWRWECPRYSPNPRGYYVSDETFDQNTSWDVDDDGEEETILDISYRLVLDNQAGQLDMSEDDPNKANGLLADSRTEFFDNSRLSNVKSGSVFSTNTLQNYDTMIVRKVRLNPNISPGQLADINRQIAGQPPEVSTCASPDSVVVNNLPGGEKEYILEVKSCFSKNRSVYNWNVGE